VGSNPAAPTNLPQAVDVLLERTMADTLTVTLSPELNEALRRFAAERGLDPASALGDAFRAFALQHGYLAAQADEGLRPEDLNSANDG
jgi:hypothetical protein